MTPPFTTANGQALEAPHLLCNSAFNRQAFHARCTKKPGDARATLEYVFNILWLGDGATVTQDQNFWVDGDSRFVDSLNPRNRFIETYRC
jgi:hypothetical protein